MAMRRRGPGEDQQYGYNEPGEFTTAAATLSKHHVEMLRSCCDM